MKFKNVLDAQTFLSEIGELTAISTVTESFIPTNEQMSLFLNGRSSLVKKLKNYRKSANQKANWRGNRYKMMKGIKAFHKSVEGKRFHRRLGRFLTSRIVNKRDKTNEELEYKKLMEKQEYLKGLNSAKQHLFVELEYFHQLSEHIELEEFVIDYALPYFILIEQKIISEEELNEDELTFIFDLIGKDELLLSLSEGLDKKFEEISNIWDSIQTELNEAMISEENEQFYSLMFNDLKKALGTHGQN